MCLGEQDEVGVKRVFQEERRVGTKDVGIRPDETLRMAVQKCSKKVCCEKLLAQAKRFEA